MPYPTFALCGLLRAALEHTHKEELAAQCKVTPRQISNALAGNALRQKSIDDITRALEVARVMHDLEVDPAMEAARQAIDYVRNKANSWAETEALVPFVAVAFRKHTREVNEG